MPPDFSREVYCLLGLPFDAVDLAQAEHRIRSAVASRVRCFLSTPNLNFLIACIDDAPFRNSVLSSDLNVADGMPLVWLARMLGVPLRERVAGSNLFERLSISEASPLRVYFFGGMDGVAESACRRLNARRSGLTCVGYECPGFGSLEEMSSESSVAKINASGADFLVVSLGAKKGQAWIERNRHRLTTPVISHLGAVVNFVAGNVKRAPVSIQRVGLEWLWRIKEEPLLWRRYFKDGLALGRLVTTRVLPQVFFNLTFRASSAQLASARINVQDDSRYITVRLSGAWSSCNLSPLREQLQTAALAYKDICIDMSNVVFVDSAFIGLMMIVSGYQHQYGRSFQLVALNPSVYRIFKYSSAAYLCVNAPPILCAT